MNKNNRVITLSIIAIIIFMAIGINVKGSKEGILFDVKVMDYIHNRTTPSGIAIMKKVTYFGSAYFFIPIGILVLPIMVRKRILME